MCPDVTVLIPSYNPGRYLVEALDSVFGQTYTRWKIILVDDASTDNSIALAGKYIADPRVTLVRNSNNLGQSKSLNAGLTLVDTPYVVQLDSDDWFYPYTLEVLVSKAKKLPEEVGVIGGNVHIVYENSLGRVVKGVVLKNRSFKDRYDFLLANISLWPRFYRTSALNRIGGWPTDDPYEGRYMEDRILLRLIEYYRFYWIDQVLYNHRRHGRNQTNRVQEYAYITEWAIRDALKRWGDRYEPVFKTYGGGRKKVIALAPKTQAGQGKEDSL